MLHVCNGSSCFTTIFAFFMDETPFFASFIFCFIIDYIVLVLKSHYFARGRKCISGPGWPSLSRACENPPDVILETFSKTFCGSCIPCSRGCVVSEVYAFTVPLSPFLTCSFFMRGLLLVSLENCPIWHLFYYVLVCA